MTIHRYTIEAGAHPRLFRLVLDENGAWMQAAEVLAQVPRCETCAHWALVAGTVKDFGGCMRLVDSSGLTHGSRAIAVQDDGRFANLRTFADFGCVQWKEK